jgi:PhoPQ-activated pathogenicity-related protein
MLNKFIYILIFLTALPAEAGPRSEFNQTSLDKYAHQMDESFSYEVEETEEYENYFIHKIKMISQQYLSTNEVNRPAWSHWLKVIEPKALKANTSLLVIGAGDTDDSPPISSSQLIELALISGSIVSELSAVPNQPLAFKDESFERTEDGIIAYTWKKFFLTGDPKWPARMAMTKSAVAAMDVIQDIFKVTQVKEFVITGASKRGWATWTTAAVDNRVKAIMPLVIDMLNIKPSFEHHWEVYGFWAPAIQDYVDLKVMDWWGSPEADELFNLVDPFSYKNRYEIPKYIINAAGDEFFIPTSSQFYYDELPGEKHLRYVPNVGHGLNGTYILEPLFSFYLSIINNQPRPSYKWKFLDDGQIQFESKTVPDDIKIWWADNKNNRDFRIDQIGKTWQAKTMVPRSDGSYVSSIKRPKSGWRAYFIEATFSQSSQLPMIVTSEVRVAPDSLPFEYKSPVNPKGFLTQK